MARKSSRSTRARRARTGPPPLEERIVDAALELFAERGWNGVSMADIAGAAAVSEEEVLNAFPTKTAVVQHLMTRVDNAVLGHAPTPDGTVRDRLFDLLMLRFDSLRLHKAAVVSICEGLCRSPVAGLCLVPRVLRSMGRTLEAAGAGSSGLDGLLRAEALALIYANAFRVWTSDTTVDMSKTMATLDRSLAQAERLASLCPRRRAQAGATRHSPQPS